MEKKVTSPVMAGLIISIILILIGLAVYFTGMYTESWIQYVTACLFFVAILWAVINNGKETNNTATFGNLFAFGFKVSAVVTVIMILYTIISFQIFPEIKTKILDMQKQAALQAPNANETQIEQGFAFAEKYFTLFVILGIVFWYLVLGVVAALIGAAVTKKRPSTPFENV